MAHVDPVPPPPGAYDDRNPLPAKENLHVTSPRESEEFERIQLAAQLERDRLIVRQYEEGLADRRYRIEQTRYRMGVLDERLSHRED